MKDMTAQGKNVITIVGKLLDVTLNNGKLSDGRAYLRANATIRVTHTYLGREETSEIPVSFFAAKFTNKGTPNPAYATLEALQEYPTVQQVGFDHAAVVRLTGSTLRENAFVTRSGQLINGWQINGSFVGTTTQMDVATFAIDAFIMDMHEETDREGMPTGRTIIKGGVVQYGGKLDVIEFIAENPEVVNYIDRNWSVNDTVEIRGRIRVTSVEEKTSGANSSWGEDIPDTTTRHVRELIITSGSNTPKDEEYAYDPAEIKKAFNIRKANIEQMMVDAKNNGGSSNSQKTTTTSTPSKYNWE